MREAFNRLERDGLVTGRPPMCGDRATTCCGCCRRSRTIRAFSPRRPERTA
ncbi:hypothetical protein [Mesorhizobium loti]|uniref:hypothetical protein n=1 Tax=Rhizobium loti TaxID=381 RepID=UPI003D7C1DD9